MTHKLRHDIVDEINTMAIGLRAIRRETEDRADLRPYLSKMEIAAMRLWALVNAEPVQEIT